MNIAFHAVFQRQIGDPFDAFNVRGTEGFIRCGKIADRSQVEYPVDAAGKEPGQRFRLCQVGGDVLDAQTVKKRRILAGAGGSPYPNSLSDKKLNQVTSHKSGCAGNDGDAFKFYGSPCQS